VLLSSLPLALINTTFWFEFNDTTLIIMQSFPVINNHTDSLILPQAFHLLNWNLLLKIHVAAYRKCKRTSESIHMHLSFLISVVWNDIFVCSVSMLMSVTGVINSLGNVSFDLLVCLLTDVCLCADTLTNVLEVACSGVWKRWICKRIFSSTVPLLGRESSVFLLKNKEQLETHTASVDYFSYFCLSP
jgi:hypothetical protein